MAIGQFSRVWRDRVDEDIVSDPDHARALHHQIRILNDPTKPTRVLDDVVSQPWGRGRRDWYDAAALIEVGQHLELGFWVIASVGVGAVPGRDRDDVGNQDRLGGLCSPYRAWCEAGTADDDGRLEWDQAIRVRHRMDNDELLIAEYPPSGVPLEIGHTEPETTIFHLRRDGGVARWPYGRENITLLLSTQVQDPDVQLKAPDILSGGSALRARAERLRGLLGPDAS